MMNTIRISALLMLAAGLYGCSKWTEPEAKDIMQGPSAPAENYLNDLRAYKNSRHKTAIFGMDATAETPSGRAQHLSAMPDSTDYIYLRNLSGGLHPSLADEAAELRRQKGTKTLADVEFLQICDEWDAMQSEREEAGQPAGTEEEFTSMCRERLNGQLQCCERYGLDGIMATFNGSAEFALAGRAAFVNTIMDWLKNNPSKTVYVRGILSTLIRNTDGTTEVYDIKGFFNRCEGLIHNCGTDYSTGNIEMAVERIISRGEGNVPVDKFLFEVTVPTPTDPEQIGISPADAAAWITVPYGNFSKTGLCVSNAQDDYFHAGKNYESLRKAIGIMNGINNR